MRVQFTKHVEKLTSLKRSKQRQPGNLSTTSREELQSAAQRYDKKFQDLLEEVNTKTGIGYKIIADSYRPRKLKVLYQLTVHLLEEEIPKQLQRRNKLVPYQAKFVEEHLIEERKCKASLDYHWLAYISKGTQPEMNAEQSNATQAMNSSESKLPNGQPSCSNSAKWSNGKWPRDGECFGINISKAKARGKDEKIRYRIQNQVATGTSTV